MTTTSTTTPAPRPVAVIDIGATAVRMAVAEIHEEGQVRRLENFSQAVPLGKDTFTRGGITRGTMEECVRVLKSYRNILLEYNIEQNRQVRVVATSAVREASNRLAFLDRVYIATGFDIEPIDEAEVNRVTYFAIQPLLRKDPALAEATTLIIEVGGGSTELLLVKEGNVAFSHTYRLGSLRLRKTLESYNAPTKKVREIMESQVRRTVQQIADSVEGKGPIELVALGGDVRFAITRILGKDVPMPARLELKALETFTSKMLALPPDDIVHKYHLSFPDAETLGPALLTYVQVARVFDLPHVTVTGVSLRDGLLTEMAVQETWTEDFRQQIVNSATMLGRKFDFDESHARHVAELSAALFHDLKAVHRLEPRYEMILYVAALLHEIGLFISNRSYHKHTMYLIRNSELFGLGHQDVLLTALVARYHRRASPQPTHEGYGTLNRDLRVVVAKLAAMVRIALALDDSRSQRVQKISCRIKPGELIVKASPSDDLSLEQLALRQGASFFEDVFGMKVVLRPQN